MTFLKKGSDNLKNGIVLGGLFGAAIVWGNLIYSWVQTIIPSSWLVLGSFSLPVYLIVLGAIVGYIIDFK
jgi:hypothetical protein